MKFWVHFSLNIKAVFFSETLVSYHITTRRHNPQDYDLNLHRSADLKSQFPGSIKRRGIS